MQKKQVAVNPLQIQVTNRGKSTYVPGDIISMKIPASTGLVNPLTTYLQFTIQLDDNTLEVLPQRGAGCLFESIQFWSGSTLLEEVRDVDRISAAFRFLDQNQSILNKRQLVEGQTNYQLTNYDANKPGTGLTNPYFEYTSSTDAGVETANMNGRRRKVQVLYNFERTMLNANTILPVVAFGNDIEIRIRIRTAKQVLRAAVFKDNLPYGPVEESTGLPNPSVPDTKNSVYNIYGYVNSQNQVVQTAITTPTDVKGIVLLAEDEISNMTGVDSLQSFIGKIGQKIKLFTSATGSSLAIGTSYDTLPEITDLKFTMSQRVKIRFDQVSIDDLAVNSKVALAHDTSDTASFTIDDVKLNIGRIEVDQGYVNELMKMVNGPGLKWNWNSFGYISNSNISQGEVVSDILLNCPIQNLYSMYSIIHRLGNDSLFVDNQVSETKGLNQVSYTINGQSSPLLPIDLARQVDGRFSPRHLQGIEMALKSSGLPLRTLRDQEKCLVLAKNFSLLGNTMDMRGQNLRMKLEWTEQPYNLLVQTWFHHRKTIVISSKGVRVTM